MSQDFKTGERSGPPALLLPTGPDTFFSPNDYEEVKIERAPDGSVTALLWGPPGKGPRCERTGPFPPEQ